jgi:hypothetical protein
MLEPTFSSIQSNIFTPICTVCHTASHPTGLDLRDGMSYALLVGVPSAQVPSLSRVEPGDPDNSYLIQKLEGTAAVGVRMPANGPPFLSTDQIAVVRQWITDGAMEVGGGAPDMELTAISAVSPANNTTVSTAPGYIVVALNQPVDASLVSDATIILIAAGGDGGFDEGNEKPVTHVSVSTSLKNPRLILIDVGETELEADVYRLIVKGSGDIQIASIGGVVLDGDADGEAGGDFISEFTVTKKP